MKSLESFNLKEENELHEKMDNLVRLQKTVKNQEKKYSEVKSKYEK